MGLSCLTSHLISKNHYKNIAIKNVYDLWMLFLPITDTLSRFRCSESLALFVPCVSESYIKIKIKWSFYFPFPCRALKAFMKHFEAPQRSVKVKFYSIFVLCPRSGREFLRLTYEILLIIVFFFTYLGYNFHQRLLKEIFSFNLFIYFEFFFLMLFVWSFLIVFICIWFLVVWW